jgi:hypothetical protein
VFHHILCGFYEARDKVSVKEISPFIAFPAPSWDFSRILLSKSVAISETPLSPPLQVGSMAASFAWVIYAASWLPILLPGMIPFLR